MSIKPICVGACATITSVAIGIGLFATYSPIGGILDPLARMLDAFLPLFIVIGIGFACLTVLCGGRMLGLFLLSATAVFGAVLFLEYRSVTLPLLDNQTAELRVLFFNANAENATSSDQIVAAALAAESDILVFAEASAVRPSLKRLKDSYDFVSPCTDAQCELLIATNLKRRRFWQLQLNPIWAERYAVLEFELPDGRPVFLAASHLSKPWMSGIAEPEIARLGAQYDFFDGPVVAVGDFNMAPWSRPIQKLLAQTEFRGLRGQPATWPASAGFFGIPIDQIHVHNGPRVTQIIPFGEGLNSNHHGFIADLLIRTPAR